MHISKIRIENFKCFEGAFCLVLNSGINILAGNNEAGKSTILEATHLALSGVLHGRYLRNELSQYLFNKAVENKYIESISAGNPIEPPYILIELYFDGPECAELALLEGNENADKEGCSGISFRIEFDEQYRGEYAELLVAGEIKSIPIEYYRVNWRSFAREGVTAKGIPIKSSIIDSAGSRFHNGSDVYISRIVRENLDEKERVEISQAHRNMKETFMNVSSVKAINKKLSQNAQITDKKVSISVDLSTQNAWETSLMTYLDDVPFHYIGKGEQSVVKTNLALSHKKSREANIVLLEEPENHLSFSKLNELIDQPDFFVPPTMLTISSQAVS